MERRTYRGSITARGLAESLVIRFNAGHLIAQSGGDDEHQIVQIAAREDNWGGRDRAALTINIIQQDDAIEVSLGEHQWLGPAADLVQAGLRGWFRPFTLLGEIAAVADDINTLQLPAQVWAAVDHYIESTGAQLGLAEANSLIACSFCGVGNPVGVGQCSACGGSLISVQPKNCPQCGKLSPASAQFCSRCGTQLVT